MATYTSNLSLKKPAQSDKIRIADLNGNADNIDAAIGADFGQSSKPSINAAINSLADGLAIVAQGDVHAAISAGQFVYVRNHSTLAEGLYVASAAISANAALSGTNLTADTSGGLNALNSKIERTYTRINEVNGLNVYLTKHGCANQLYIQGTLTNAVTGSDTIDVCSTSDLTGLNFTDYIAGVEFNTGKVIGFFSSGGYVKMRISGGMSAGEAFSGHIVWC